MCRFNPRLSRYARRKTRFSSLACTLVACLSGLHSATCSAGGVTDFYHQRTQFLAGASFQRHQQAIATAMNAHANMRTRGIHSSGGTTAMGIAKEKAVREYMARLVPATKPSPEVAHIPDEIEVPVDTSRPEKKWTKYYDKAKTTLRPNVEYLYKSNAHVKKAVNVTLSREYLENLKDNFDILMWYRNELDKQLEDASEDDRHQADENFRKFLDYFVADIIRSLPNKPRIRMSTGQVEPGEWKLDERKLRQQLVMAYRYLVAKYQIYPEYEKFGPADRELLISMMKISFLMGTYMHPEWFNEMQVSLDNVSRETGWKKPMADALKVLKEKSEQDDVPSATTCDEGPCIIRIPKPKPRHSQPPVPQSKPVDDGEKIEIIVRRKA